MGRIISILLVIGILGFGIFYFWKNYSGLWYASAPAKENIVELIQNVTNGTSAPKPGENKTQFPLQVPDGYSMSVYVSGAKGARDLTFDPNGLVVASLMGEGKVVVVKDGNLITLVNGLDKPHGVVFNAGKLYVAETKQINSYDYDAGNLTTSNKKKIVDLPGGGRHFTRSMVVKDGKLYTSIGSYCDACKESDSRYASVWVSNLDGSDFKLFASGLRNSVFMTLNPNTNEIWATEMGRDFLGDDLPPEEVNIIREGNYGWPYCYGDKQNDPKLNANGSAFNCTGTISPHLTFQAHSAPLGLDFLGNDLLVSYHGSWNRSVPTGYKVVKFSLDAKGSPVKGPEDFITGWREDGPALGRPVDILVKGKDVYISDDKAGVIYLLKAI